MGTSIELFTGGGGLARAMHEGGFRHLLVNELERRSAETLRVNGAVHYDTEQPEPAKLTDPWPLVEGDVHEVDFRPWTGRVDVVAGGVPCQPWSLGGAHKGYDDPRNLWPELFRCVRETRPRAVIAENVKGLLRPSFKPYYDYILRELATPFEKRVGAESWWEHDARLARALRVEGDPTERYDVRYLLVNAADYGVPQVRWRVFVVAFRRDLGLSDWEFPTPTHSSDALRQAQIDGSYRAQHGLAPHSLAHHGANPTTHAAPGAGLQRWRTLRDAIQDLPEPLGDRDEHPDWLHHYGWPGARQYPGHTPNDLDRPAKTIKAGVHGVPGGESVLRLDNGDIRYMTVREVARAMTFPDTWRLAGPRGEQMRQLGNAVPVRLGLVMSQAVAQALRPTLTSATRGVPRGDS
ncbi:MAG: DNA cytosine methyltransferase [Pseudonocardiales bacterium]|nr:DNA cytosine methyltransferase [Pseudonocardiales bacterium]MBV9030208.1 DNA cytosine methyltransferase [Pseudonocardiales bacterium]MBW0011004.1 DNA cytosine methyltransferase [Pseudonocardiales bacterium]